MKLTVADIKALKRVRQLTIVTAFDADTARAAQQAGIDILLTWATTTGTLDEMRMRLSEVRSGAPDTLIGCGIPALPGYTSEPEATRCAFEALQGGAGLIYASGMELSKFQALARQGIPCVGHVGLIPFHATWTGGLRAVGKRAHEAAEVYRHTKAFEDAGCVAVEMECVPEKVAAHIARTLNISVFSMGSGSMCDAQFLFSCDILGSTPQRMPRHAKQYANQYPETVEAFARYREDVLTGGYPQENHKIRMDDDQFDAYLRAVEGR